MPRDGRNYVGPDGAMYRVAAYDIQGVCIAALGPYATVRAARGQRKGWRTRYRVAIEMCCPLWVEVEEYYHPEPDEVEES